MINPQGYWIPDAVTADVILLSKDEEGKIWTLLIKRGKAPYENCLAIPGGFLDQQDLSIEDCAVRELKEETNVSVAKGDLNLIGVFSRPDRDPRGRFIGLAYYVWVSKAVYDNAVAGDDASAVVKLTLDEIGSKSLAFDHNEIFQALIAKTKKAD